MAWITQGAIADRSKEMLGKTDIGVVTYRRMLLRELENIEAGKDPKAVIRDLGENACIKLPLERSKDMLNDGFRLLHLRHVGKFSPISDDILKVFSPKRELSDA
jgi:5,5'-dehydrodivanillate O-demethylase